MIDITTTASTAAISGSATTIENVYLGNGTGTWASGDLTKYTDVDNIYATNTKLTFADATKFGSNKLDLSKASADITITSVGASSGDLNTLFVNASDNDKITLTTDISGTQSITLTDATENVTLSTAITVADANLTNMVKGAAANDSISVEVGDNASGNALALTLSGAKDTVDVSAASGKTAALTITATGFDKTNDKIDFGTAAKKGALQNITLGSAVSDIKSITVTDGVLSLVGDGGVAITGASLTIGNVLLALKDANTKDALIDQVLLFTDKDSKNYLVTAGGTNASTDDVAIVLGVTTTDFNIANGVVTLV